MKVAVVGGGLAGLAAALECADAGAEVVLFEGRTRLGGATFSVERDGRWLDNGQHITLRCCTAYLAFLERLGVADLVPIQPRLRVPVLREGEPPAFIARNGLPAPLHLGSSLLSYPLLAPRERLAAVRAAAALRKLDPDDPALDESTFGDWLRAHGQSPAAIEALWNLIALPTLNLHADEASLAACVQVFRTGLLDSADASDVGVATVPLQRLHGDAATAALEAAGARLALGTPVLGVDAGRVELEEGTEQADAVLVAVPHQAVARIVPPGTVDADALARLGSSPIVNLHVHYDRRVLDEPFAAAVGTPVQWLFDRTGSSGIARGQLVAVSLSAADADLGEPVAALRERYLPALERLLPGVRAATVLDFTVTREPRATFRAAPGSRRLRPGPRTATPGLYLAGAWTDTGWPATMEGAVRSGVAAARAALADYAGGSLESPALAHGGGTVTVTVTSIPEAAAHEALERARTHLLSLQHRDGWWKGELETNVTIDAEDLFLRRYLGLEDPAVTEATARWIRGKQRDDGTWATFFGGDGDLSTTVEAYVALRLAGDPADAAHMKLAAAFVREAGGIERSRVFTRMWLSLLSLWSWTDVPSIPPELILLPPRAPLSIYSFGCWARQTIVALSVCSALRPATTVPFAVDELRTGASSLPPADLWGRAFHLLDRGLQRYEQRPAAALRRRALRTAERWIVERQERDGSWGGIQPPWVWSMIGLHALGYRVDHPVLELARAGLDSFTVSDEQGRRIEACQSPVWDTALALIALLDGGLEPDHEANRRAARWLAAREVRMRGDWAVRRPDIPTGGFPFEFENDNYPDVDDTAVVVLALRRAANGDPACRQAADRGLAWTLGMQSKGGGWGAFDVDNTSGLPLRLPFCDFGAVTDPPSADVSAHVLELLGHDGLAAAPATRRGLDYLLREQERDGSWFGRWGANHLYGTGAAVPALAACGMASHPSVRAAISWLDRVQNPDGGFGEDLRSYRDAAWRGRGASTASQTAWALLAYDAAGHDGPAVERAVRWLVDTQRPGGGWDEPQYTGTGFPGDFYLNYHLYRDVFPVMALGRVLGRV